MSQEFRFESSSNAEYMLRDDDDNSFALVPVKEKGYVKEDGWPDNLRPIGGWLMGATDLREMGQWLFETADKIEQMEDVRTQELRRKIEEMRELLDR